MVPHSSASIGRSKVAGAGPEQLQPLTRPLLGASRKRRRPGPLNPAISIDVVPLARPRARWCSIACRSRVSQVPVVA